MKTLQQRQFMRELNLVSNMNRYLLFTQELSGTKTQITMTEN